MRFDKPLIEKPLTDSADAETAELAMLNSNILEADLFETDLPADFQELAGQLSADADRLSELYGARPEAELVADRPVFISDRSLRNVAASPRRWLRAVPRVAAAVAVLAGLTLAVGYSSAWRGMIARQSNEGAANTPFGTATDGTIASSPSSGVGSAADNVSQSRPVSISAETLRMSGEEMEILRHATEGEVVEVDI